jgi:hypothetical protein
MKRLGIQHCFPAATHALLEFPVIFVCVCVCMCVCVCVCVCNVLQYRAYVILVQQVGRRLRQTPPPPHISRLHHQTPTLLKVSERLFNKRGVKRSCPQATD